MRQSIDITKTEKDSMVGVKMNETHYFNPVLRENGSWCISKESIQQITNSNFLYLKDRAESSTESVVIENYDEYKNISEATDLSDVFSATNITTEDVDNILSMLDTANNLQRLDIRFRGITWSNNSLQTRESLIDKGFLLLESDLAGGTPVAGAELVTPEDKGNGTLFFGEEGNPNKQVWAAMYYPEQTEIAVGQITTTPANYIEGKLQPGMIGLGSEVSKEKLIEELNNRGKSVA